MLCSCINQGGWRLQDECQEAFIKYMHEAAAAVEGQLSSELVHRCHQGATMWPLQLGHWDEEVSW